MRVFNLPQSILVFNHRCAFALSLALIEHVRSPHFKRENLKDSRMLYGRLLYVEGVSKTLQYLTNTLILHLTFVSA